MTCNHCTDVALYRVGPLGYCKTHRELAVTLRKSISRYIDESNRSVFFDHIVNEKERRDRAMRRMRNAAGAKRRQRK